MASHKQSFQCFDTIMDDPPLKPPFPHGHCSTTSFRGSYGSTRLEPLEDRGCYLCADHQQAMKMTSEASGAYSNPWYHFQTHPHPQQYTNRRPIRPEEAPGHSEDHHHHHRHSRKIVLVKNSDPSVRRTIVLHRRSLRSLALFMDEVSELMHCLIRKLYTLEGHKIDSVQSLLQCPSILVCVGREPFHPLLLDSFRKNSYDKLPRLNIKSRSSVCSDEKGAKKNVNFGLETNRSTIHPRCDSSNRSARLSQSISSEKLFPNRLNSLPPGHRSDCPHTGENMMDDDIEKRVLFNQDGSLSMEMKVRFRLLHNETLHWSTEVKKSKSSFNESHIVPDDACSLSHGCAESCSEADSLSAGEADETYSTKCYQRRFEEQHCQHCCTHCQEYDIWKNPVPPSQGSVRRIRSSSSSASSRRIVCKKASTDSMRTMSSEEYTEHVVEKATCIQQTIGQQGDTTIGKCTINHCCSRSEVRSVTPKTKSTSAIEDKRENTHISDNDENRPDVISSNLPKDQLSVKITQPVEEDERPVSVVSSSSQIFASLKENEYDEDDEDVDLPLSISRASRGQQEYEESKDAEPNSCSVTPCKSPASLAHLSPRPPSKASSSGQSKMARKFASPEVGDEEVRSEASASPRALSGPKTCKCVVSKDIATLWPSKSNDHLEDIDGQDTETEERALSAMSAKLNISTKSLSELSGPFENGNTPENTEVNNEIIEERSSSAISVKSNTSGKSNKTNVSEVLEQGGRAHSAMSIKSHRSDKSRNYEISDNVSEEQNFEARTSSAMSVKSNTSVRSKRSENCFDELAKSQDSVEERAVSVMSSKSNISFKSSQSKEPQSAPDGTSEKRIEEKASSVISGTLNKSGTEDLTNDDQTEERVHSSFSIKSNISARSKMSFELSEFEDDEQDRAPSSFSIKSFVSQISTSDISEAASLQEGGECLNVLNTQCVKLNTPETETATQVELPWERSPSSVSSISNISKRSRTSKISEADQEEALEKEDVQERASSTISVKSTTSARSRKSKTTPTPGSGEEMKERAPSVMSIKSNASLKSNKSKMEEETENRASSALSVKSEVSTLSKKSNLADGEQLEERAPSALSKKSNSSCISKQSKVSDMAADVVAKDRNDLKSASVLSSKSNISAKSMKTMVSEKEQTEEQAQSAFSAQSNQSGVTVSDGVEVTEERALSAMSSKSNASERLKKSNNLKVPSALPRGSDHQTEERAQSALSTRSSVSTRSSKSRISNVLTELVDAKDQEEERASSALSAKSNVSAKSKKSNASTIDVNNDNKEKGDRVPSAMSGRSDISTKTSISAKSTALKVSEVQAEEPDAKDQEEERASSALSAKSNISTKSKKSNASTIDVNNDNKEKGDRVPSAMSGRSDISTKTSISAKSTASKVSEVQAEEPDAKDQEEERASSALSAKSKISTKSEKSNASTIDVNNDNKEKGERVPSAMSGRSDISNKTSISAKSKASNFSEVQAEEPGAKDLEEERASSALSAKSNVSAKSKKSNASAINVNTDYKEKRYRVPSAMSGRSDISTKTSISANSKASNFSEVQAKEPDDEESQVKAPSVTKSRISVRSESKHSEEEEVQNLNRPQSAISIMSEATPDENEISNEGEMQERAPSAVSAKSNYSVRSRTSEVSEIIIDEPDEQKVKRAPSSRSLKSGVSGSSGPEDPVNEDKQKEARTESALSSISNVSTRSNKPEDSELISNVQQRAPSTTSVTSKTSARSKRSNISGVAPKETGNTDTGDVRSSSAMSAKSCASEKSKHSERTAEDDKEANKVVERTTSSLSVKSTPSTTSDATVKSSVVPTKSNASAKSLLSEAEESDRRSTSVLSNASAESKVSKAGVNKKENRSPSKLSVKSNVSTRSKKSKISEGQVHIATNTVDIELNRGESPVSDQSKVSQAENSNKYGAIDKSSSQMASSEKDSEHEKVPASPLSKKSKISSVSSASERVLTPTSTSVSIGIVEDHEADDVEEIDEGAVSVTSRTSASSKTEICGRSDVKCLSESPVRITSETTQTPEERPKSFASAKSNVSSKSKSKCSHCSSTFPRDTNQDRDDVASNKSSKTKYLNTSSDSQPSAKVSVRQSSLTEEICPSNKDSGMSVHTEITGQDKTESPDVTHKAQSVCSKCSSTQQKRQISSASAISDSEKSNSKEENIAEMTDRPKSNISRSSSHLKVNGQKNDVKTTVVNGRNNKLSTKSQKVEDNAPRCCSETLSVTSGNQLSPIPPKSPKKSKKPVILLGGSNDRISQTVPAPVPKEEHTNHLNAAAEKTESCRSDTNVSDIKSEKSSKCRKRIGSDCSCHKMDEDMSELSPSCLPNASPTEVVNEWLRKIPSDTALCDLGDEFHDNFDLIEPLCTSHVPSGDENVHETLQRDVTKLETQHKMEDGHVENAEGAIDKKSPEVAEGDHSQRGDEPKMFDSSVLVMKVLLSPKLDRCNSLPEVSPVYGRKLSTSAQGLLDCLANLQLLDFGTSDEDGKKEKYQELMSMLKSLWLCDPKDSEKTSEERNKRLDKEHKARSSSGVDVNSGSKGSGKSSVNDGTQVQINTEYEGLDTLTKVQEVDETVEEEASETPVSKYDSATPDIASQAHWTPETKDTVEEKLKDDARGSDETIRNNDSPRELVETPLSSNKSSGNNNNKEIESDNQEDTSSGSAPTLQRGQLSKKLSQDPDPLWVLNLLNKLEKQFMTNYVDAMAEFKVRWNLDDNEQFDAMISELQDEVHRRIQSSIDRELRKIQGRAGRPRPPNETMSRESTIQMEQRRRRLKVMRNQSVDPQPAKSDDEYTMTGTDFSDQRSDDEYCPCDTCLKKKMVSKHVLPVEMLNSAPVIMDFDLRRILQIKKLSPTNENIESTASKMEGENVELEAVKEEDEKEGANKEILASIAQVIKEEYEKRESEEGEEKDNASSTYVEDCSVKQSNISKNLRKDVDEVGEIAEMSDNTKTAQHKTVEQDEEKKEKDETDSDLMAVKESASSSKINDELDEDVANDDISEFDDIMQAEEATEEHTEEESEEQGETAFNETAEEGQTAKTESIKEGETTGEETVENRQTAEVLAAEKDDIAGNETAEDGETAGAVTTEKSDDETGEENGTVNDDTAEEDEVAENETAEDGQTAEDETGEESETVNDDTAEEDEVAENETAEDGQTAEDETGEESETVNDDTVEEDETAENETAEDRQNAENETGEGKTVNDDTAEEHETAENETAEDGQTAENETGEDRQTAENEAGEGETVNDDTAEEDEVTENETAEDGQTAEDETGKESETVNDDTAEEHEMAENETAEDGQTAEDETGEEVETVNDDTAEEHETAENETAEDGQTAENETGEDGQTAENETGEGETVNDDTAEEDEVTENETAEDGQTAEDETGEESETVNDDTVEDDETAENEIAEDGQTAGDETGEEGETVNDNTAEEDEMAENETEDAEDGQTAGDETGEEGETVNDNTAEDGETAKNETAEDGQTAEDETGKEGETVNDDTAEEDKLAENETAEDGETVNDNTAEDDETAENETEDAEDGQTAGDETGEEGETVNDDTAEEDETADNETAEDGETAQDKTSEEGRTTKAEIAGEDKITEDETAEDCDTAAKNESVEDRQAAGEDEITEDETAEEGETSANNESVEDAEAETDEDGNTGDDAQTAEKGETANDDTVEEHEMTENESVEGGQTAEVKTAGETDTGDEDTADEGTTKAETEMSDEKAIVEDGTTAEDKNAEVELAERKQTPDHETTGEETDKSQSDVEEDKESVSCEAAEEGDILSNLEDTESLDETPLKNQGDVVVDSVDDKGEECEEEDDDVEITANKVGLVVNNGESAEAGDEAEDDTEPDEREHDGNAPALQPVLQPKQIDDKPDGATSFNVLVKHNSESEDGADADGEDSETDEHSHVVDLSSGLEGKPQKKTAHKNFKMFVHALRFLKLPATGQPERREEDNEHEVEDEETPEDGSDDADESSCVEKDEVEELNRKEKGKLSDITEDTAEEEEVQTNETNDDSKDSEWESSENALQKQMTKSSLESQPGSFEEVHEELTKNQKGSNHLKANW